MTKCPSTHPWAYRPSSNFDYCCRSPNSLDKQGVHFGALATRGSTCFRGEFIACPAPPCKDFSAGYAPRTVQFHPHGGQLAFVWLPSRHVRPMGVHRPCSEPNEIKKNTHPKRITALSRDRYRLGSKAGTCPNGMPTAHEHECEQAHEALRPIGKPGSSTYGHRFAIGSWKTIPYGCSESYTATRYPLNGPKYNRNTAGINRWNSQVLVCHKAWDDDLVHPTPTAALHLINNCDQCFEARKCQLLHPATA